MIVNTKQRYPTGSPICGQQHNLEDQSSLNTVLTYLSFQIINWSSINAINNVPTCVSTLIITYGPIFDEHIFLHLNLLINEPILYWLINTIPKHTHIYSYYKITFSINSFYTYRYIHLRATSGTTSSHSLVHSKVLTIVMTAVPRVWNVSVRGATAGSGCHSVEFTSPTTRGHGHSHHASTAGRLLCI